MSKAETEPTLPTVKLLFALSCNHCAFSGCEEKLTDPSWAGVKAQMAHIRGRVPGAARYDPTMTDDERRHFDNIILLCPNHHTLVDKLQPEQHTVELLTQMKARAMEQCGGRRWASEAELDHIVVLALAAYRAPVVSAGEAQALRDRLAIAKVTRDDALRADAEAENRGLRPPNGPDGLARARQAVDDAAKAARSAGVDVSDLVGPNVGRLD